MAKRYILKGINDDETTCDICGKVELKRVMWVVEVDADGNEVSESFHCGTTCGAKLMQQKISVVNRVVESFEGKVRHEQWKIAQAKENELGVADVLETLHKECKSFAERQQHPLWAKLAEIRAEARSFAESQNITVEIK